MLLAVGQISQLLVLAGSETACWLRPEYRLASSFDCKIALSPAPQLAPQVSGLAAVNCARDLSPEAQSRSKRRSGLIASGWDPLRRAFWYHNLAQWRTPTTYVRHTVQRAVVMHCIHYCKSASHCVQVEQTRLPCDALECCVTFWHSF